MTVSSTVSRWAYLGDGVSTGFAYTARIFTAADLKVYVGGVLQGAGFAVSGVGLAGGGTVGFAVAPPAGLSVVLVRDVAPTQDVDYVPNDPFPAETHERALDKLTILAQQLASGLARGLRLADTDPAAGIGTLPAKAQRAFSWLAFDVNGDPVTARVPSATGAPVSDFAQTLLAAADATALRALLSAIAAWEIPPPPAPQFTTGDVKLTLKAVGEAGWAMMNDGTIGPVGSGATYPTAESQALFTLIWTHVNDYWVPMFDAAGNLVGRGVSAAADWAAYRRLSLPRTLGRALAGAGFGAGLTYWPLGAATGEEAHPLVIGEIAPHLHYGNDVTGGSQGTSPTGGPATRLVSGAGSTAWTGGGQPHNTMQPTTFVNVMVKF